jgi:predicted dehydrogenase
MSKIRLGVIGLGMGRHHMLASLATPGATWTAIAEPNPQRLADFYRVAGEKHGRQTADRLRALPVFDDYREMVRAGAVDAVINALPTPMHAASSLWLMKAGMHVLCEKPPTCTDREMIRVAAMARSTGRTYMFVRQQRFDPTKLAARRLIAAGRCGRIYHAESTWIRSCGIPFRGGWGVNRDAGGGVLLDLGVHVIDDAWFLMGCPRPVAAFAGLHCAFSELGRNQGLNLPYDADDAAYGLLRFADGQTLAFGTTFALNTDGHPHQELGENGRVEWLELRVFGDRAGLDLKAKRLTLRRPGREEVRTRPLPVKRSGRNGSAAMVADFVHAIQTGQDSLNPPEQALALMRMLAALRRSADTGRSVAIPA